MAAKSKISRRDFINGIALTAVAGSTLSPHELMAQEGRYPPGLTGMRGSHAGSFEISHALSWGEGVTWPRPDTTTDDVYDLIVVGGGLSGLAAAYMYRQRVGGNPRVLILDNHDDFGGHAKRNEFEVDGHHLIGYGGSQSIDSPSSYSPASAQMLKDVGVDTEPFYEYFDQSWFRDRNLGSAIYFSRDKYGSDSVQPSVGGWPVSDDVADIIDNYPFSEEGRANFIEILTSEEDYLAGLSREEKNAKLLSISYTDFLRNDVGAHEDVVLFIRDSVKGFWGVGWDALSAMEGYRLGRPGTWYLGLDDDTSPPERREEPYIFHFPDGNAGVARSIVRTLIPEAVPGRTMEDLVTSRVNYELLDRRSNSTRIRLDSTAVDVRHVDGDRFVDVTYVREGKPFRVRGKHAILACYNRMVPYICPEVPADQTEAIRQSVKIPLVYINVALRKWRAFEDLGYRSFSIPQPNLMHSFGMDFPVSIGGYDFTQNSDEPTVIHGTHVPTRPDSGLTQREQSIAGRRDLYELSFDDYERDIMRSMNGALGGGGFDAERDIAAITVNRWPHGYADEYNELFDPADWNSKTGPHVKGAAQIGRISIANSDASAFAYVNGAFDAANRAVNEQLAES